MTYRLVSSDSLLTEWPLRDRFLGDTDAKAELDAQVSSGDYFAMLATRLDEVSKSLKAKHRSDYALLETTIDDLLYLQQNYTISKR